MLVMSELSGGTTIEVRAPVVARGVGNVSETSERTAMAAIAPETESGTGPPLTLAPDATNAPDVNSKGVQT
jgi:hypothetical protein